MVHGPDQLVLGLFMFKFKVVEEEDLVMVNLVDPVVILKE